MSLPSVVALSLISPKFIGKPKFCDEGCMGDSEPRHGKHPPFWGSISFMSNAGQGPTAAKPILLCELASPAPQRQGWDGSVGKPSLHGQ